MPVPPQPSRWGHSPLARGRRCAGCRLPSHTAPACLRRRRSGRWAAAAIDQVAAAIAGRTTADGVRPPQVSGVQTTVPKTPGPLAPQNSLVAQVPQRMVPPQPSPWGPQEVLLRAVLRHADAATAAHPGSAAAAAGLPGHGAGAAGGGDAAAAAIALEAAVEALLRAVLGTQVALLLHTPATPPPPQVWGAAQVPQEGMTPPHPSPCCPQLKPSCDSSSRWDAGRQHTPGVPPPPQVRPGGLVGQVPTGASWPPQPSPWAPQVKPSCTQVLGVQGAPQTPGVPAPPQVCASRCRTRRWCHRSHRPRRRSPGPAGAQVFGVQVCGGGTSGWMQEERSKMRYSNTFSWGFIGAAGRAIEVAARGDVEVTEEHAPALVWPRHGRSGRRRCIAAASGRPVCRTGRPYRRRRRWCRRWCRSRN